jgi:hypothetical protein
MKERDIGNIMFVVTLVISLLLAILIVNLDNKKEENINNFCIENGYYIGKISYSINDDGYCVNYTGNTEYIKYIKKCYNTFDNYCFIGEEK